MALGMRALGMKVLGDEGSDGVETPSNEDGRAQGGRREGRGRAQGGRKAGRGRAQGWAQGGAKMMGL